MPATGTLIHMAAERGGSAAQNGGEDLQVQPGEPLPAAIEKGVSRCADHIGHLKGRPWHLFWLRQIATVSEHRQRIQRTGGGAEVPL